MKKIFLGMLAIALMASPAVYANGGKKKARKKAKIECSKDKCCESKLALLIINAVPCQHARAVSKPW